MVVATWMKSRWPWMDQKPSSALTSTPKFFLTTTTYQLIDSAAKQPRQINCVAILRQEKRLRLHITQWRLHFTTDTSPPKRAAPPPVEKSVTPAPAKDDDLSIQNPDERQARKKEKKEKSKKRKAVEVTDENDEEPSKKHKAVLAKFEKSSQLVERLKRRRRSRWRRHRDCRNPRSFMV